MQKKRKAIIITILTAFMLCIAVFVSRYENESSTAATGLMLSDGQTISAWLNDQDGIVYYFIPSYAEMEDITFLVDNGESVKIDGKVYTREDSLDGLSFEQIYSLMDSKNKKRSVVFLKSHNVSSVYISTDSGSLKSVLRSKDRKESAKVVVVDKDGNVDLLKTDAYIKGRGNSTWKNCEKKPFSIFFDDSESVLGMTASSKWALLANALDYSSIRNAIVFDTAKKLDLSETSEYEYVDLYLNGLYNGLYLICQSPEMFFERGEANESNLYLFKSELPIRLKDTKFTLSAENNEAYIDVCYPKILNANEQEAAENIIGELDYTITNESDDIGDIIDIDSWVKKYLIDEVFENYDAALASSYFYTFADDNSKVYAGPVWDYDRILGNRYCLSGTTLNPQILYAKQKYRDKNTRTLWYSELYLNPIFYNKVVSTYKSEFKPIIDSLIENDIDRMKLEISDAKKNDDLRWGIESAEEYSYMKDYLVKREAFLDDIWLNQNEYAEVTFYNPRYDSDYMRVFIPKGSSLADYAEEMELFVTTDKWYLEETTEIYDLNLPVKEDIVLVYSTSSKVQSKVVLIIASVVLLWLLLLVFRISIDFKRK